MWHMVAGVYTKRFHTYSYFDCLTRLPTTQEAILVLLRIECEAHWEDARGSSVTRAILLVGFEKK